MELSEVKNLLEDWFNSIYTGDVCKKARASYAKLKLCSDSRTVPTSGNYYEKARIALKDRGDFVKVELGKRLVLAMGSGMKNRNPTIVELCFEERQLQISAWAKEGLIPQKSAPRAVSACLEDMKLS